MRPSIAARAIRIENGHALVRRARWLAAIVTLIWLAAFQVGYETSLVVLSALGMALVVSGLARRPSHAAIGLSMLCVLDPITRLYLMTGGLLRWNALNYVMVAVAIACLPAVLRASASATGVLLSALVALMALQTVTSPAPELALQQLLNFVAVFGLIGAFARAGNRPGLWYSIGLVNGTLGATGGLVFYAMGLDAVNPNAWGWCPLAALLAICLAAGVGESRWLPVLAFVNLLWVFLSGSRGDLFVGLLASAFLAAAIRGLPRRVALLAAAAVLVAAIGLQFTSRAEQAAGRLERLARSDASLRQRTSGRTDLILGGWYVFLEHPLGVGTGGFPSAWAALDRDEITFRRGRESPAHAGWITVLAENGLPGVLLLAAFVASFGALALRQATRGRRLIGWMAFAVLTVALLTTEFQSKGMWLAVVGAMTILQPALPSVRRVRALRGLAVHGDAVHAAGR